MLSGPDNDLFCIPPKCEVIKHWDGIDFTMSEDLFIDAQELTPGVLTARCLINKSNSYHIKAVCQKKILFFLIISKTQKMLITFVKNAFLCGKQLKLLFLLNHQYP
jgi:hypothetical protein